MEQSETLQTGLTLITIIFIMIAIPCTAAAILGYKMLKKLSYYPSKTPAIQTGIFLKLVFVEVISFGLLLIFYHMLETYAE